MFSLYIKVTIRLGPFFSLFLRCFSSSISKLRSFYILIELKIKNKVADCQKMSKKKLFKPFPLDNEKLSVWKINFAACCL